MYNIKRVWLKDIMHVFDYLVFLLFVLFICLFLLMINLWYYCELGYVKGSISVLV